MQLFKNVYIQRIDSPYISSNVYLKQVDIIPMM